MTAVASMSLPATNASVPGHSSRVRYPTASNPSARAVRAVRSTLQTFRSIPLVGTSTGSSLSRHLLARSWTRNSLVHERKFSRSPSPSAAARFPPPSPSSSRCCSPSLPSSRRSGRRSRWPTRLKYEWTSTGARRRRYPLASRSSGPHSGHSAPRSTFAATSTGSQVVLNGGAYARSYSSRSETVAPSVSAATMA